MIGRPVVAEVPRSIAFVVASPVVAAVLKVIAFWMANGPVLFCEKRQKIMLMKSFTNSGHFLEPFSLNLCQLGTSSGKNIDFFLFLYLQLT